MNPEDTATAVTFLVVCVSMWGTHWVADHWLQTDCQARDKGLVGKKNDDPEERKKTIKGRLACLRHVITYTACTALITGAAWAHFELRINWTSFLAGQMISAITHYWADRRHTLARLAKFTDKVKFIIGESCWVVAHHRSPKIIGQYVADRFTEVRQGKVEDKMGLFYQLGSPRPDKDDNPSLGTGAYALDQSWHLWWIFIAAVVTSLAG